MLSSPEGGGEENYYGEELQTAGEHIESHSPFKYGMQNSETALSAGDSVAETVVADGAEGEEQGIDEVVTEQQAQQGCGTNQQEVNGDKGGDAVCYVIVECVVPYAHYVLASGVYGFHHICL